jgi:hypothetical protein
MKSATKKAKQTTLKPTAKNGLISKEINKNIE